MHARSRIMGADERGGVSAVLVQCGDGNCFFWSVVGTEVCMACECAREGGRKVGRIGGLEVGSGVREWGRRGEKQGWKDGWMEGGLWREVRCDDGALKICKVERCASRTIILTK